MPQHKVHIFTSKPPLTEAILLTKGEESRLQKIKSPKVRAEFIHSHTFLNQILTNELCISIDNLEFTYNPHGKPYLCERLFKLKPLFFSLSHSGSIAVAAISHGVEIGIDVEDRTRRNTESCKKLSERFYTINEQYFLNEEHHCNFSTTRFFQIWTLKEAYLKALGSGINVILSTLDFSINDGAVHLKETESETPSGYNFYTNQLGEYTIALAANTTKELDIVTN